ALSDNEAFSNEFWTEIQAVRGAVNKLLEEARNEKRLGGALQAEVTLYAEPELAAKLSRLENELRFVLLTSKAQVALADNKPAEAKPTEVAGLSVLVTASEAAKCDRCWHHVADVGTIAG